MYHVSRQTGKWKGVLVSKHSSRARSYRAPGFSGQHEKFNFTLLIYFLFHPGTSARHCEQNTAIQKKAPNLCQTLLDCRVAPLLAETNKEARQGGIGAVIASKARQSRPTASKASGKNDNPTLPPNTDPASKTRQSRNQRQTPVPNHLNRHVAPLLAMTMVRANRRVGYGKAAGSLYNGQSS